VTATRWEADERFCINGHDTDVVGRSGARGRCKECNRQSTRRARSNVPHAKTRAESMWKHGGTLPAQRLRLLASQEGAALAWLAYRGASKNTAKKAAERLWKADRISIDAADRWCIALGTHLSIVYPEVYYIPLRRPDRPLLPEDDLEDEAVMA
jgi:hypothetical protein